MSSLRNTPFPPWDPDRLAKIARSSGQSLEQMREDIRHTAQRAAEPGHVGVNALRSNEYSAEEQAHLNSCEFCQELHESINTPVSNEDVSRWLEETGMSERVAGKREALRAPGDEVADLDGGIGAAFRRHAPALNLAASIVGWALALAAVIYAINLRRADPFVSLVAGSRQQAVAEVEAAITPGSRFAVARDLAANGKFPQANVVLLTAFERSDLDANTLASVTTVLNAKPSSDRVAVSRTQKDLGELKKKLAAEREKAPSRELRPYDVLQLSTLQMKSGEQIEGYQSLAKYLESVEAESPATIAYEAKFAGALSQASDVPGTGIQQ